MGLIKEFLGHADIRSTERYAKLAAPTLVQMLRPVDRARATSQAEAETEEFQGVEWRGGRDSNPSDDDETP